MDFHFFGHGKVMENQCWKGVGALTIVVNKWFLLFCYHLQCSACYVTLHGCQRWLDEPSMRRRWQRLRIEG